VVVRSGCPIRLCGSGPEFEAARTLIKTRLRVAMTQAQVASRWEPRSPWLLGWKAVRDFPACGAFSAMPMLLDADPTSTCFLPMLIQGRLKQLPPQFLRSVDRKLAGDVLADVGGGASAESGAVLGEWESRRSTCAATVWERLNFGGGFTLLRRFSFPPPLRLRRAAHRGSTTQSPL
jgi:hypothetical protein